MKKTLLSLMLVASLAQAEEVTVFGYGKNFDQALRSAKIAALEQVTGTWISSEHELRNGKYSEEIVQYNGGVIKSYKVKSYDGEKIEIVADVDVIKDNKVGTSGKYVPPAMREKLEQLETKNDEIALAMYNLDAPHKAFYVDIKNISYVNMGGTTDVTINAELKYNQKWFTDLYSLSKTINRNSPPNYGMQNKVVGGITSTLMTTHPIVAVAFGMSASADEPEYKESPIVCFSKTKREISDECYESSYQFANFRSKIKMEVWGLRDTNIKVKKSVYVDSDKLYTKIYPGDSKSHRNASALTAKYYQPGYAFHGKEVEQLTIKMKLRTSDLKQVDKFQFVIL